MEEFKDMAEWDLDMDLIMLHNIIKCLIILIKEATTISMVMEII